MRGRESGERKNRPLLSFVRRCRPLSGRHCYWLFTLYLRRRSGRGGDLLFTACSTHTNTRARATQSADDRSKDVRFLFVIIMTSCVIVRRFFVSRAYGVLHILRLRSRYPPKSRLRSRVTGYTAVRVQVTGVVPLPGWRGHVGLGSVYGLGYRSFFVFHSVTDFLDVAVFRKVMAMSSFRFYSQTVEKMKATPRRRLSSSLGIALQNFFSILFARLP